MHMLEVINQFIKHPDLLYYLCIPLFAAFIGWGTNWLAIQLTFKPIEFLGIKPFLGWQGVIPRKAEKLASVMVDHTLSKLSSVDELFQELEPEKLAAHIIKAIDARIEELIDEVMIEKNEVLWENLPTSLKNRLYTRVRRQMPTLLDRLIDDISANIENLVDIKEMVVTLLSNEKEILNRVFKKCGESEIKFVVNSGAAFGFLFGVIQMLFFYINSLYNIWPNDYTLPIFGFLIGYATNWIALNLIFRPLNPVYVGKIKIHGLFLRRQKEVSVDFSHIITSEVLTIGNLMDSRFNGSRSDRAKAMIKRQLRPLVDAGIVKTIAQLTVGPEGYASLKRSFEDKAIQYSLQTFSDPMFNKERAHTIEQLFYERMQAMSSADFQDLLRPAFHEDEWILVLMGGLLGTLSGVLQLVWLFS